MERFISTGELARLAQKSAEGIRYDIRAGKLVPDARTAGGAALFRREHAERWVAERTRTVGEAA